MSLNKFVSSSPIKNYLNVGCNDVKCNSLTVNGVPFNPTTPPTIQSGIYIPSIFDIGVPVVSAITKNFKYVYVNGICTIYAQINCDTGSNQIGSSLVLFFSIPTGMNITSTINNQGYISTEGSTISIKKPIYLTKSPSILPPEQTNVVSTLFQTSDQTVAYIDGLINISLTVSFQATIS
jgi:hypothetical protein